MRLPVRSRGVLSLPRFLPGSFLPPSRPGLVTSIANFLFCAVTEACKTQRLREENAVWDSFHALEPGDKYSSNVFVYTTASVFSNPARGPTVFTGVVAS